MKYAKVQILRRTVLAGLVNSMAPLALLKIGQIVGELPVLCGLYQEAK